MGVPIGAPMAKRVRIQPPARTPGNSMQRELPKLRTSSGHGGAPIGKTGPANRSWRERGFIAAQAAATGATQAPQAHGAKRQRANHGK